MQITREQYERIADCFPPTARRSLRFGPRGQPCNRYSPEQMHEAVRAGTIVEFSYFTVYCGRAPVEEIAGHIRTPGIANVLPASDFGQTESPYSDEGIALFMEKLRRGLDSV